jgi:hypothetical protein
MEAGLYFLKKKWFIKPFAVEKCSVLAQLMLRNKICGDSVFNI